MDQLAAAVEKYHWFPCLVWCISPFCQAPTLIGSLDRRVYLSARLFIGHSDIGLADDREQLAISTDVGPIVRLGSSGFDEQQMPTNAGSGRLQKPLEGETHLRLEHFPSKSNAYGLGQSRWVWLRLD